MENRSQIFWGMLALSVSLVIGALVAANALKAVKRSGDTITVTGSAKMPVRSDYVIWRGTISAQKPNRQDAYRDVNRQKQHLDNYFSAQQVPDSLITFQPVMTREIRELTENYQETGRILAFRISQTFEIRSDDVDRITNLSKKASELIDEGLNFESHPPEYLIANLAELRSKMLAKAAGDAHQRAVSMAESVGSGVGALRNARMGVFQITARNSTEVRDYGIYDTRSLEKDITAVVRLTFAIE